eukprot:m.78146 g.78146  ORF g.78146 m.78146 type:complete len:474 (-) comp25085_c1_seq2:290-1711(-)
MAESKAKTKLEMSFIVDSILKLSQTPEGARSQHWDQFTKLFAVLGKLIELQAPSKKISAAAGSKDFAPMLDWLQKNGVDHTKVEIKTFGEEGNGLQATADVKQGEQLLTIPSRCMMCVDALDDDNVVKRWIEGDKLLSAMQNVSLAVYVLITMNDTTSQYTHYLRTLPKSYTTPLYYTLAEIEALKGSNVQDQVMSLFRAVVRQYIYILGQLKKDKKVQKVMGLTPETFLFEDYRWAVATVMTRQNGIRIKKEGLSDPKMAYALIPLWDMVNHDAGTISSQHDAQTNFTEFYAMRPFKQNQQIYMYYGARANSELLYHSGFVFDNNNDDYMTLKLGVGSGDKLAPLKRKLLEALTIPSSGDFTILATGELDPQLNAFIRINNMTEAELNAHLSQPHTCGTLGDNDGAINEENETKACLYLETRCKLLLRTYTGATPKGGTYHGKCVAKLIALEKKMLSGAAATVAARGLEEDL